MAAITVTDMGKQYGSTASVNHAGNVSGQRNRQEFMDLMNKTAGGAKQDSGKLQPIDRLKKNQIKPKDFSDQNGRVKEPQETRDKTGVSNQQGTAAKEAIREKAEELVGEIAGRLDIPEEDVRRMMELLGIQALDLFNPNIMAELVVELSGKSDMMSLVLDGELYEGLTELQQTAAGLLREAGESLELSSEMMDAVLEELQAQSKMGEADIGQNTKNSELTSDSLSHPDQEEEQIEITIQRDGDGTKPVQREAQSIKQNAEGLQDSVNDPAEALPVTIQSDKEQGSNRDGTDSGADGNLQNFLFGNAKQAVEAAVLAEGASPVFETPDTESIMKQITDYMRIHIGSKVTEMEIQLQPANLGSINLQVAMKNGAITAQFTAQNESVKQALETQIVQLRENLEQQGIKIEAVEVTVASHEFERNLQQGGQSKDSEDARSDKRSGRRRIVLDEAGMPEDTIPEDTMQEEDRIQVRMMKQSGNSVSLLA